jgi:hypothetical protein
MSQVQRAPRFGIRLSAELKVEGRTLTGVTRDLSTGGVGLTLDRPLAEGAFVRVMLFVVEDDVEAEGAHGLDLTGTVQWVAESDHGYSVGIRFGTLTAAQSGALQNALRTVGG